MPERDSSEIPPEIKDLIHREATSGEVTRLHGQYVKERASSRRSSSRIELNNLIHAGMIGWLEAPRKLKYDETRSSSLVDFAQPYVHKRMIDLLHNMLSKDLIHGEATRLHRQYVGGRASGGRIELNELKNAGMIGWLEAWPKYDETRNSSLVAFARSYVHGRMMDYIRPTLPDVWVPQKRWAQVKALRDAKWTICTAGEEPTTARLAAELDWSVGEVIKVERETPRVHSLDANQRDDDDDDEGFAPDLRSDHPMPEQAVSEEQIKKHMDKSLMQIDEKQRTVVISNVIKGLQLRHLAVQYNVSTQRVGQIKKQGLAELGKILKARGVPID